MPIYGPGVQTYSAMFDGFAGAARRFLEGPGDASAAYTRRLIGPLRLMPELPSFGLPEELTICRVGAGERRSAERKFSAAFVLPETRCTMTGLKYLN